MLVINVIFCIALYFFSSGSYGSADAKMSKDCISNISFNPFFFDKVFMTSVIFH
ncbi:hypothetical protein NLO413_0983 [Candidatus Neoehrlichia lotoris str. RAC413]|uniref:Uncharacterized protein n=2 Tax=Candidatus Neoehrlichia procyonis TaxID=467750 RepID=A0A0F3NNI5_9RICK|nr:hypothetical protein NLO413_0983 [Candidatus Neoehrlichia lotoris str. RAC413]